MDNPITDFLVNSQDRFIRLEARLQHLEEENSDLRSKLKHFAKLTADFADSTTKAMENISSALDLLPTSKIK